MRHAPQLVELHLNLGLVRHEQGRLREALELKPELERVRGLLGYDLLQLGRAGEAASQLEQAYEEESGNEEIASWLGLAGCGPGSRAKRSRCFTPCSKQERRMQLLERAWGHFARGLPGQRLYTDHPIPPLGRFCAISHTAVNMRASFMLHFVAL